MKRSELARFLNHIERDQELIRRDAQTTIDQRDFDLKKTNSELTSTKWKLESATEKIARLESELADLKPQNENLLNAARILLPKIRVNIYQNSTQSTPRWFKSGKWWSRETGGLDADFVATLTADEIQEAVEFYGKTELPLMLPRSHREIKSEQEAI
jgi:hypothetical protein